MSPSSRQVVMIPGACCGAWIFDGFAARFRASSVVVMARNGTAWEELQELRSIGGKAGLCLAERVELGDKLCVLRKEVVLFMAPLAHHELGAPILLVPWYLVLCSKAHHFPSEIRIDIGNDGAVAVHISLADDEAAGVALALLAETKRDGALAHPAMYPMPDACDAAPHLADELDWLLLSLHFNDACASVAVDGPNLEGAMDSRGVTFDVSMREETLDAESTSWAVARLLLAPTRDV